MAQNELSADDVTVRHPEYAYMAEDWLTARDLYAGTRRIQFQRERYLPRHPRERPADYNRRLQGAEVYNAFQRALNALVGYILANPPKLGEDTPSGFRKRWENIDRRGQAGQVFTRKAMLDNLMVGQGGILVDYPKTPAGTGSVVRLSDERRLRYRPYWDYYKAEEVTNWSFDTINEQQQLNMLVLCRKSNRLESGRRFLSSEVTTYRVFYLEGTTVFFEVYESTGGGARRERERVTLVDDGRLVGVTRIPFSVLTTGSEENALVSQPPLQPLIELNLAHWRIKADRRHSMHIAHTPIPYRIGYEPPAGRGTPQGPVAWSSYNMIDIPNPAGRVGFLEHSGAALASSRDELTDLERQMAQVSVAFLASETRAAETAEAKRIDQGAQMASLKATAYALKDCIEYAAQLDAEYAHEDKSTTISFPFEDENVQFDPQTLQLLYTAVTTGDYTLESFLTMLQMAQLLPQDADVKKELLALQSAKSQEQARKALNAGDRNLPAVSGGVQ